MPQTLSPKRELWLLLTLAGIQFTHILDLMTARMIPGMAILTSAAEPSLRGTFMTLNSAVQSAAMGVAAFVGGNIITRDSQGLVQHFWIAALLGACASLAAVWLAGRLDLRERAGTDHAAGSHAHAVPAANH